MRGVKASVPLKIIQGTFRPGQEKARAEREARKAVEEADADRTSAAQKAAEASLVRGVSLPGGRTTIGTPPDSLTGPEKQSWRRLAKLWGLLLSSHDRELLASYCRNLSDQKAVLSRIKKDGGQTLERDNGTLYRHPAVATLLSLRDQQVRLLDALGGTPTALKRLMR